jgi:CHASE3 domain sensor protein
MIFNTKKTSSVFGGSLFYYILFMFISIQSVIKNTENYDKVGNFTRLS